MLIFAHRGYCGRYPENTMLSFRKAIEAGADGIELDVHMTSDGELVIIHDETVDRTSDGRGAIFDMTLTEVKKFNVNLTFPEYGSQEIPTFEEYCEWAAANAVFTNVEVKTDNTFYPGMIEKIWDTVVRYGLEDKVLFSSFNLATMMKMRGFLPDSVGVGALFWIEDGIKVLPGTFCKDAGFQAYHPEAKMLSDACVADCHANGIDINVWSANDPVTFKRLYDWGCHIAITDWPAEAAEWLKAASR